MKMSPPLSSLLQTVHKTHYNYSPSVNLSPLQCKYTTSCLPHYKLSPSMKISSLSKHCSLPLDTMRKAV